MIVKLSLCVIAAAVTGLLLGLAFDQAHLTGLAEQVTHISALALLSAFCLLLVTGLLHISRLVLLSIREYFTYRHRIERKLLYYSNRQRRLTRLFQLKKTRVLYDYQQKRKRLLLQDASSSTVSL